MFLTVNFKRREINRKGTAKKNPEETILKMPSLFGSHMTNNTKNWVMAAKSTIETKDDLFPNFKKLKRSADDSITQKNGLSKWSSSQ